MAAFPRRRSLWLKVAVLVTTVWLTICFLLYNENRVNRDAQLQQLQQGLVSSGIAAPQVIVANELNAPLSPPIKHETSSDMQNKPGMNEESGPEQGTGVLVAPKEQDPGEMGRPVILPTNYSVEVKKLIDDGWLNNAFNQYVSDLISVHRSLPDPRDEW
ncbi:hypothetical protein PV325_003020 [Microctonus aethiopoides]|uniref:Polypeptide N-acetylgalactosaminyltransferase 9 n=1 Tax=Microctonus aethiopoides TaxID=144406 RepID=A0AA39F9P6_9HYME|nr:hypothetical protein PV325_003020 [Microctonus aethiopoides]KAK0091100.1 hypothetical protein PV326_003746 [Microctonus aethiopoides]KAK0165510.1 hypothetical protein PV328_004017 [Microctonus aethiopoides]